MNLFVRFSLLGLIPLLLAVTSCTGTHRVQQGMTQQEVASKLGQPIRSETKAGQDVWYYNILLKERFTSVDSTYNRPEEDVYERDLRIDTYGAGGGISFNTLETYEEKALHFDRSGQLLNAPPYDFVPNRD